MLEKYYYDFIVVACFLPTREKTNLMWAPFSFSLSFSIEVNERKLFTILLFLLHFSSSYFISLSKATITTFVSSIQTPLFALNTWWRRKGVKHYVRVIATRLELIGWKELEQVWLARLWPSLQLTKSCLFM